MRSQHESGSASRDSPVMGTGVAAAAPVDLYRTDRGRGSPALVFLHYYAGSSRAWDAVVAVGNMAVIPGIGHLAPYEAPAELAALIRGVG